MVSNYYVKRGDSVYGPYSGRKLLAASRSGELVRSDEVAKTSRGPWKLAADVKELEFPKEADGIHDDIEFTAVQTPALISSDSEVRFREVVDPPEPVFEQDGFYRFWFGRYIAQTSIYSINVLF